MNYKTNWIIELENVFLFLKRKYPQIRLQN